MRTITNKIYVDLCYYTVHKFKKSFFKSNGLSTLKRHL